MLYFRDNGKEFGNYYLGFRVQGSGLKVKGLGGYRVKGPGFRVWVWGSGPSFGDFFFR